MPKTSLFTIDPTLRKGQRTQLRIIQAAFACIARDGYYRTTFQTIADQAQLSQPLIVKAFGTRENIFPTVAGHLLGLATVLTNDRIALLKAEGTEKKIEAYFDVSLEMMRDNPDLVLFYMNIYYLSTYDRAIRAFNLKMRKQAMNRLIELLREHPRLARARAEKLQAHAASLHDYLVGSILNGVALHEKLDLERMRVGLRLTLTQLLGS